MFGAKALSSQVESPDGSESTANEGSWTHSRFNPTGNESSPVRSASQLRPRLERFARRTAASWLPWFLLGWSAGSILFWEG